MRQAGCQPDPRQVHQAYALTMSLRYVFGASIGEQLPGLINAEMIRFLVRTAVQAVHLGAKRCRRG